MCALSRTQGRRLASYNEDGGLGVEYKYNSDGIRTQKTIDGDTHYYTLDGSKILSEEWSDGSVIHLMIYVYDANGSPIGFRYRKSTEASGVFHEYLYGKNIQGDIIYIFGKDGTKYASYVYDAWGKQTVTYYNSGNNNNVAPGVRYNPFTYRGYYYDEETGLYYVSSRYYDSEVGRFISPDTTDVLIATPGALTDKNLYAYCDNNPVMREDKDGQFWNIVIGAAVGAVVGAVSSIVTQALAGELDFTSARSWARIGVSAAGGALSGALAATCIPVSGQMIANGLIGAVSSGVDTYLTADENTTVLDYVTNIAIGTGIGVVGGKIGGNGTGNKHLSASAGRAINRGWTAAKGVFKEGINTTLKEIGRAGKYYYSQVCKQSIQCGIAAIKPIIASNIPNFINITIGGLK